MDPMTIAAIASTVYGIGKDIFGGGTDKMQPATEDLFKKLMEQYRQGFGAEQLEAIRRRQKTQLGNEAGALKSVGSARLQRQGGGSAAENAMMARLDMARLSALGQSMADIDIDNEEQKRQSLQMAINLVLNPNTFHQMGQGYANLAGAGLDYLINRPPGLSAGNTGAPSPIAQLSGNQFTSPFRKMNMPNLQPFPNPYAGG
jgi:hypothetical protein